MIYEYQSIHNQRQTVIRNIKKKSGNRHMGYLALIRCFCLDDPLYSHYEFTGEALAVR